MHSLISPLAYVKFIDSAAELFRLGAAWGHVDCAYELASMSAEGRGVERSAADAAKYLQIVAQVREQQAKIGVYVFNLPKESV